MKHVPIFNLNATQYTQYMDSVLLFDSSSLLLVISNLWSFILSHLPVITLPPLTGESIILFLCLLISTLTLGSLIFILSSQNAITKDTATNLWFILVLMAIFGFLSLDVWQIRALWTLVQTLLLATTHPSLTVQNLLIRFSGGFLGDSLFPFLGIGEPSAMVDPDSSGSSSGSQDAPRSPEFRVIGVIPVS